MPRSILLFLLLACFFNVKAQERREFSAEEKATHTKNVSTIMGKWKTTETAIKIVEASLKPKEGELNNIYTGLFDHSGWEFATTGKFSLITINNGKPATENGDFTINAQFLTLYLSGKTYRCRMKVEEDGTVIIQFPVTEQSFFGLKLSRQ